ncbi:MAG: hypothetical protein J0I84_11300 [Terrimonas sp.]|uniref:PID-CTERM protein-sorting domain-containing protein n=1 Tax=Terrimonas sp. TaxID=1914338 RepID=UPI000AEAD295|nr:hypothetical protein [Terrimonas sp.]MBN8787665.1 hypothetical protein [Terrimonas sp.]
MKLKTFFITLILMCGIAYAQDLQVQPVDPGGDPDTEVPIDGGVGLLVAAGIAYGAKKAHDKRKISREKHVVNNP